MCTQSYLTLRNPMNCSLPGSSVHPIFRQVYWSGLSFPSTNLPDPVTETTSLASPALASGLFKKPNNHIIQHQTKITRLAKKKVRPVTGEKT